MTTSCPSCAQSISIDPETFASLHGSSHFACPACSAAVPVPLLPGAHPIAPVRRPVEVRTAIPRSSASSLAKTHRGVSRNLLILGSVALLTLGGLAAFIASRKSGDVHNTNQNISNDIINNNYFQNLIASGVTTEKDLRTVIGIQAYGDGFIGISGNSMHWEQSMDLAKRTGSEIILIESGQGRKGGQLVEGLRSAFRSHISSGVWVRENHEPRILEVSSIASVTAMDQQRRVILQWRVDDREGEGSGTIKSRVHNDPWKSFDTGPLIFEHSFSKSSTLEGLYCFGGQYGGRAVVIPGNGLKLGGGHSSPMVWAKAILGDRGRFQFEVQLPENVWAWASWTVKGVGYGICADNGYLFILTHERLTIKRDGVEVVTKELPEKMESGQWVEVKTDMVAGNLAVTLDGRPLAKFSDSEPLTGSANAWCGFRGGDAVFRNLKVWSSEANQSLPRQFAPQVSDKPVTNGELLYEFKSPAGPLGAEWWQSQPENTSVREGAMVLSGENNGNPVVILTKPLEPPLACEVEFEYLDIEALNLGIKFLFAGKLPTSLADCDGAWLVGLPRGGGNSTIQWEPKGSPNWFPDSTPVLAKTGYFSPVYGRKCLVRSELTRDSLRVFLDGGLLLKAKAPSAVRSLPVFLGLGQFYASSKIHSVRIYKSKVP